MAARLLEEPMLARTVGDEVESFVLVLLWIAGRYADNKMTSTKRAQFLYCFDEPSGTGKRSLFHFTQNPKIVSKKLMNLLSKIVAGFKARYYVPWGDQDLSTLAELEEDRKKLETHTWLMGLLRESLKDEEW